MKVSNSRIGCFKACRRLYELKYLYGLEPVNVAEPLERGLSYHKAIEDELTGIVPVYEDAKVEAMVKVFKKRFPFYDKISVVEKWFEYKTPSGHTVVGRIDGKTSDGIIVEHKTTGSLIDGAYLQRLDMDEQIPTYMLGEQADKVLYSVCSTPTIRQKRGESREEFVERCVSWFADDPYAKFQCIDISRTSDELKTFAEEQDAIITEMENCKLFYRNPNHCTKWGRLCEYAPICMHYNPNENYVNFKERNSIL